MPALPLTSLTFCAMLSHRKPQVDNSEQGGQFLAFPSYDIQG